VSLDPPTFVCVDCGAHVYDMSGAKIPARERCCNCMFIRRLELPPGEEALMRERLGVPLIVEKPDDPLSP